MATFNNIVSRQDAAARIPEQVSNAMLANLAGGGSAALTLGRRIPVATNQTRFPVLSALPTAYWVDGDTGLKQTTEAAWDNAYIDIGELAAIAVVPDAVLEDAGFDIWASLQPLLEDAIARKFDAAVFFGAGSPPMAFPDDIVTAAISAGNTVERGESTQADGGLYEDYNLLLATVEEDGYVPDGAVGNITIRARERGVRDGNGQPILRPATMPDVRFAMPGLWPTGLSAAELIVGDFSNLVVGVRRDITFKILTESVITDDSTPPQIIFNLAQQDLTAMRVTFRAGFQVANPINYQGGSSGYPFAVLTSPDTT